MRSAPTLAVALACAFLAEGMTSPPLSAQDFGGAEVLRPGDPACRAGLHDWTRGGAGRPLAGYGLVVAPRIGAPSGSDASAALGFEVARGARPWLGGALVPVEPEGVYTYPGPSRARESDRGFRARLSLAFGPVFISAEGVAIPDDPRERVLVVGAGGPALTVAAGSLALRSGPTCGGGLVLAGSPRARALGVELRQGRPFRIPALGEIRFGVQLGVMREGGPGNEWPLWHSMRVELGPYGDDWYVGLNRAVIFGGSDSSVPVTRRTVAQMLIGLTTVPGKDSRFENQIASVDLRGRVRVGGAPVLVSAEYGTDDSGWAFVHVPGIRVAAEVEASGSAGWLGLEGTVLRPRTRGYPSWYRHGGLAWGWTDRGHLMGNAIGGEGWSLLATWRREGRRGALDVAAGVVERGEENLFSPTLQGLAARGTASLLVVLDRWEWSLDASADQAGGFAGRFSMSVMRRFGDGGPSGAGEDGG